MNQRKEFFERFLHILESVTKKDFALLPKIKGLEKTLSNLLREAQGEFSEDTKKQLEILIKGLDNVNIEEKKIRLLKMKEILLNENLESPSQTQKAIKEKGSISFSFEMEDIPDVETYRKHRAILTQKIEIVKGIGPKIAKKFHKKGIETIEDLLFFLPRTYEDRRKITPIGDLVEEKTAVVFGEIIKSGVNYYSRKKLMKFLSLMGQAFLP